MGVERTENRYMGIACNTDLIGISLLGRLIGLRVQIESFCFILSRSSSQEVLFKFLRPRGMPRCFEGKDPFVKPRMWRMFL